MKRAWTTHFSKRWDDGNVDDLDPLRVAKYVDENITELAAMDTAQRVPAMALSARLDLNAAANRGTGVHAAIEALMGGDEALAAKVCPPDYWVTVQRLIAEMAPTVLHAERVAINRQLGLAGTFDIMVATRFGSFIVDWKSRGADSKHGLYPGEAAQLGGYGGADYLIDTVDGAPKRIKLPELTGGLVVLIKPDSYEAYPIDLATAIEACTEMHAAWRLQSTGQSLARKATGKPYTFATPVEDPAPISDTVPDGANTEPEWCRPAPRSSLARPPRRRPARRRAPDAHHLDPGPARNPRRLHRGPPARRRRMAGHRRPHRVTVDRPAGRRPRPAPHLGGDDGRGPVPGQRPVEADRRRGTPARAGRTPGRRRRRSRGPPPPPPTGSHPTKADRPTPTVTSTPSSPGHAPCPPKRSNGPGSWISQAKRHNRPFGTVTNGVWSARCLAVNTALHTVLADTWEDDETEHAQVLHALVEIATGYRCQPTWLPGPLLGALTIDQAKSLTETATAFAAGDPPTSTALVEIVTRAA